MRELVRICHIFAARVLWFLFLECGRGAAGPCAVGQVEPVGASTGAPWVWHGWGPRCAASWDYEELVGVAPYDTPDCCSRVLAIYMVFAYSVLLVYVDWRSCKRR